MMMFRMNICLIFLTVFSTRPGISQANRHQGRIEIQLQKGECWWGGVVDDGFLMPFTSLRPYQHNLAGDNKWNQIQPLLISSEGRYLWCEDPFLFEFNNGKLTLSSDSADITEGTAGTTLQEAYLFVSRHFFPPSGKLPAPLLFTHPQYNTWIELTYNHNQQDILRYARGIKENGFPTGVFMIDDSWQTDYGTWEFRADRFPDPKAMIAQLHDMGFKVMVWVCPFISADSQVFRELRDKGFLIKNRQDKKPAMIDWWDGFSAVIDLTHPDAVAWFKGQLSRLMNEYQVDGFKFDGGDAPFYIGDLESFHRVHANAHTEAWARLGLDYPYNEYRACWKMGGQALAQRLRDKNHNWEDLGRLIPDILAQGLMGYAYVCPDMIGGGEFKSFLNLKEIDQELVVRSAQCQALMPMMQFSVAPWRILSAENLAICKKMADVHVEFAERILELAKTSAKTGEPIVRHMEYVFPHLGYEKIIDQFLLGENILVAPVLEKGARSRFVQFPPGRWRDQDGTIIEGPCHVHVPAPLEKLPWFELVE
jgi:alpha-glucosidase (family GH31 glycosyl hydrolase)